MATFRKKISVGISAFLFLQSGLRAKFQASHCMGCNGASLLLFVWMLFCWGTTQPLLAYQQEAHQQLTFSAARHLNACAEQLNILPLTPLQVRYIAKANVKQASPGFFKSLVRWNYYERDLQRERSFVGLVNTRMHNEFNDVVGSLSKQQKTADKYAELGRIVSYIQDMTSPAHVVPIFYTRFWRLNISDRFNNYSIDMESVETMLPDMCNLEEGYRDAVALDDLLVKTADRTLAAIQSKIDGLPGSWQVFWKLDKQADEWGEYGVAGNNFGRKVDFPCEGHKCIMLDNDPLYREFANLRHVEALKSTLIAMYWMQRFFTLEEPQSDVD
ncbi:MAG: hypothetical protein KUG75_05785 [Pseudomonadales bacterium]|nr:hypothetical protein [Pseudomonadales bacterium]